MARYADIDVLLEHLTTSDEGNFRTAITQWLEMHQVEDVAPVIHAHWETDKHAALDFCSSCGEAVERYVTAEQMDKSNYKGATYWNYCPHCGAKMDEEVE